MGIRRKSDEKLGPGDAVWYVNLNVILAGSKQMSRDEQDALVTVDSVRVLICDGSDPDNVLVDDVVEASEFSTGSVGYKFNKRSLKFTKSDKDNGIGASAELSGVPG